MLAHPIGALSAYTYLTEFQPRGGSRKACSPPNGLYHKKELVPFLRLTTHLWSCDRRKPEARERQRHAPFWCQRNTAKVKYDNHTLQADHNIALAQVNAKTEMGPQGFWGSEENGVLFSGSWGALVIIFWELVSKLVVFGDLGSPDKKQK